MFNESDSRGAIEKYTGDKYIQHNPHVEDGKEGFIKYFEEMAEGYTRKPQFDIILVAGCHPEHVKI